MRGAIAGTVQASSAMRSLARPLSFASIASLAVGLSACAHAGPVRTSPTPLAATRVLVLAPELETPLEGVSTDALAIALRDGLMEQGGVEATIAGEDVRAAMEPECTARLDCLRSLGSAAGAEFVAATTLVALGDTAMLRVRFVAVDSAFGEQTRQTVVEPASEAALSAALADVGHVLAGPFAPEPIDPRANARRRWRWLGPSVGVAAAAAIVTTVLVARPDRPPPDIVIVPP